MEEFEDINTRIPDLSTALAARIAAKQGQTTSATPAPGTVDPYALMMAKKRGETEEPKQENIVKWPEEEVKRLEDYCKRMGIQGFNPGRMSPIAALAMLKQKFGEDYTGVPLEERVPAGYEKAGTKSTFGPNYPYSQAMNQKKILHG